MNFEFSEEELAAKELAEQIFGDESSFDRTRKIESDPNGPGFDEALWAQLAESHLIGLSMTEELGGQGFNFLALCLVLEEVGRNLAPVPLFETIVYGLLPIQQFGSEQLKQRLIPPVLAGDAMLTAALFEIGDPSLAQLTNTRATKTNEGYRLTGEKVCVPYAATANQILVSATGDEGLGLFLVSPEAPGVSLNRQETTAHEPQFVVKFEKALVDDGDVLAKPGEGAEILDWLEPRAITALAAIAVGAAEESLRRTAEYTSTRKQFGREIGSFQAVSLRAADAFIDVEAMRSTMWQAAWQADERPHFAKAAAVAKWWACMGGHRVSHTCQHLHGGIGSDIDYPIHRYFLRLKHVAMTLGGASQQLSILGEMIAEDARQETNDEGLNA
ncbi:MAG: acyl-CoA dehydrogenase family protein [Myxococcota bacterium]